jgi:hypothetical protein
MFSGWLIADFEAFPYQVTTTLGTGFVPLEYPTKAINYTASYMPAFIPDFIPICNREVLKNDIDFDFSIANSKSGYFLMCQWWLYPLQGKKRGSFDPLFSKLPLKKT